jgi:hypothetical protein
MDAREDIELLDSKLLRLKVEYEKYFMNILKREPQILRDEVERLIRRWSDQPITNTALKFKYQSLVARYNSLKYYWTRTLRAIEEGRYERRAEGGDVARAESPEPLATDPTPQPSTPEDDGTMTEVYQKYLEARRKCKQPTEGITLEKLKSSIENQKRKVENNYGTKDVDVKVHIKDGAAKIAIVLKKKQA